MGIEIGRFGIWRRQSEVTPELAREVERLGFGALWVGGSPDADLAQIENLLEATETIPVVTGIVNMWKSDAQAVAASYHRVSERHPHRFLLGVGIGHPEATQEYRQPYETIVGYLDALDEAGVPKARVVLAALGPRVLEVSAIRTAGAHPYLTTPRHTRFARQVVGDGVMLAPEQTVILTTDPATARRRSRDFTTRYLRLVNYRNNLLREGWSEADLTGGGSDELVAELVLTGSVDEVATGIRAHIEAGADHVTIQDIGPDPVSGLGPLAEALFAEP
jgi:probable F420-dependent oxidoreductase